MAPINIGAFLTRRAYLEPDKIGLICGDQRLSFDDMNRRANRTARALAALGIGRGDRVAVLLRNGLEYYDFYFGLAKLGAVLTGINWRLAKPEVRYILENSGAKLLFYGAEFEAAGSGHVDDVLSLEAEFVVGASEEDGIPTYNDLISAFEDTPFDSVGGDDDPLVLMYTSGTTGYPKGAQLTHNQFFWCSLTISHTLDHRQNDVNLLPLPMYHVGGISFVTTFVHLGSTVVLLPTWNARRALELIEREQINHFMAVPAMLKTLLGHAELDRYDLSSLRWLLASAAPVPPELIKAYYERGILVLQSYGLTETAGPATVTPKDMAITKLGTAGLPFFHTEVRLVGANGEDVSPGDIGEIWIRGPHVISRYWGVDGVDGPFRDGWFCSGDLATQDADGFITIVDRKKDMIISGGENIYPAELERFLHAHVKIAEIAIVGMPDEQWGETVCAVAVLREGETLTLDELQAFCEGRIARFKIPRRLIVREEPLPMNPTGKLLRGELRRQLLQQ